ncbi:MAG: hypothetical protein R3234_02695 [Thermoanaerobaculia bacterium]|nr:hypothetical protein [Thermoanaerobaculia bacterium]
MSRSVTRVAIVVLTLVTGSSPVTAQDQSPTFDDVARAFTIRSVDAIPPESPGTEPPQQEAPMVAPVDVEILAIALPSPEPDKALVPVVLEIPSAGLLGERRTGQLEGGVRILATRQGQEAAAIESTFSVELSVDDPLVRTGLKLYGELLLEPGEHTITALVLNSDTGARGQAATTLEVPATFDRPTLQPLVSETASRWRVFRIGEAAGVPFPFRSADGDAYLPAALPGSRQTARAGSGFWDSGFPAASTRSEHGW